MRIREQQTTIGEATQQNLWRRRGADLTAFGCIVVFFVCFFPHVLLGRRFIIAGDALYYSYPLRTVAWRMIRQGELPVWTPHVLSGYPLLSMAQVAIGYPLTWGYLFVRGPWAEQLYVLAPFVLSPMFTYAYAREIGRSRLAALLAGLAFGYGGMMCSFIANSGMLTNSLMWAPLVLLFIDRAQRRTIRHCLFWAALFYTMSVLAGHGQSYVYLGVLALAYGLCLSSVSTWRTRAKRERALWSNWRPFMVATGALMLAAGVAGFQLLESLRAARYSIRSTLSFEVFGEGSFSPREALLSIGAPLYHYVDTSAYVAPLAVLCAVSAILWGWRAPRTTDVRLWFWLAVAILAFALILGTHTPLYALVYRIPVLNSFRVSSRHTFEWTFALSILAAYGWDAAAAYFARGHKTDGTRKLDLVVAVSLLLAAVFIGVFWWRATYTPPVPNPSIYTGLQEKTYWFWKLAFTGVTIALALWCFRISSARTRTILLAATVLIGGFVEPSGTVACWWNLQLSLPARRLHLISPTTRYLEQLTPEENRVYSRAGLFAEEFNAQPRLDAPNLPAVYGLHNVAGMEPLILERYSRALGGVGPDSVTPRAGFPAKNDDLFEARSHVLDLLNTTHVVSFANLKTFEEPLTYKDGIGLSVIDLDLNLSPGATARLSGGPNVDQIALVTTLANSVNTAQSAEVARLTFMTSDGRTIEKGLRAGVDTAEWAHERADVHTHIKHSLAPIYDTRPGDAANTFPFDRYWARLNLNTAEQISRVEITNLSPETTLTIWRASLYDSRAGISHPLVVDVRSEFWTNVYDSDGVQIIHNTRACPRAWLVTKAEAVESEEALRRIRGESTTDFDPRVSALLEVKPDELPKLSGGDNHDDNARIVKYKVNDLAIKTETKTPTVLVLSEIFYPGWTATLDGQPAKIFATDYLLRGVALPAGSHTVEMHYGAPAARKGAIISILSLSLLVALGLYARRSRKAAA